jgi:hypothetical protein
VCLVAVNSSSGLGHFDLHELAFAFSALRQPRAETFRKAFRGHAKAGLDSSLGNRQRIVEVSGIREISHAELVEPFQRARTPLPANYYVHFEFLGVHAAIITLRSERFRWPRRARPLHAVRQPDCFQNPDEIRLAATSADPSTGKAPSHHTFLLQSHLNVNCREAGCIVKPGCFVSPT